MPQPVQGRRPAFRNPEPIAHGDRRDEARYEDDPDQLVRVRYTFPTPNLPRDQHNEASAAAAVHEDPAVVDAAVIAPAPSVWDASPPDEP